MGADVSIDENGDIRRNIRLWIESAHQSLVGAGHAPEKVCGDVVRTFTSKEQFFVVLVSDPQDDGTSGRGASGSAGGTTRTMPIADGVAFMLEQGAPLDTVAASILAALPDGEHTSFSILQAIPRPLGGCEAHLVECDAPPLFLTRSGQVILLPVLEDISYGHLVRECRFLLRDGDHMAMVSEGFIRAKGWSQRWGWGDIATSTRRWTDTGCDAEQLLGALIRTYCRLAEGEPGRDVTVVAMHVRPLRSATVWSGPPVDPVLDQMALERLMAEPGQRVICGGTTAQIAARLLGVELEIERRPPEGWDEIPPTARLEGVHLVTEGLVTLSKAGERLAAARTALDLPRTENGATRLARTLWAADSIHFIVGLAVNPQQADDDGAPLRQMVMEKLMDDLKAQDKLVSVEYL